MFWKLYCPPLKDVNEGRSIGLCETRWNTPHRQHVCVVVRRPNASPLKVVSVTTESSSTQYDGMQYRQVWIRGEEILVLSNTTDWQLTNALSRRVTHSKLGRSANWVPIQSRTCQGKLRSMIETTHSQPYRLKRGNGIQLQSVVVCEGTISNDNGL